MENTNQCVICYSQFKIINTPPSVSKKIYNLCSKYLHSDIMKGSLATKWDLSAESGLLQFCQNCFEPAAELNDMKTQFEILEKSISDMALMFAMGILNRRSKCPKPIEKAKLGGNGTNALQLDCTGLTDCASWDESNAMSRSSMTETCLELPLECVISEKPDEFVYPIFDIGDDDEDESYIEVQQTEDPMEEDDNEPTVNPLKSPVYFPSSEFLTTESNSNFESEMPVIEIKDLLSPINNEALINFGNNRQSRVCKVSTREENTKQRRKTKLIPLVEMAEESNSSSNTENATGVVPIRLYSMDPKSVQPGRDRKRVLKAVSCYKYRLKKKREAEQKFQNLQDEVAKLKTKVQTECMKNGKSSSKSKMTGRRY